MYLCLLLKYVEMYCLVNLGTPYIFAEDLALLLTGNRRKTSHIEFGAHQAILVVNDEAKEHLPEELSTAVVLTIYESKGLEFDDVLIYNFFKDSQVSIFCYDLFFPHKICILNLYCVLF